MRLNTGTPRKVVEEALIKLEKAINVDTWLNINIQCKAYVCSLLFLCDKDRAMKKLYILLFAMMLVAVSCERYEDILGRLNDLEHRVEKLENECIRLNSNIGSLQAILSAVQQNDYVTEVMKIMEAGKIVGYSITFAQSGTVTLYHGSDGLDGSTPNIGIRKASDGHYYWTVDDEWLTDDNGAMVLAGDSGQNEGYVTPQFRVSEGVWYISYDNGNSWREIGPVGDGENGGDSFFKDVQYDGEYICFTLLDDTKVVIPRINKVKNHWEGKKWYAYGTSITSTSQGKYVPYVTQMSGLDVVNKGIGGGGIITNTKVKDAVMNTTDGKLEADLITLEVGANDASAPLGDPWDNTADTFLGSLTQCINYLLMNTNARIVVMSSPIGRYTSTGSSTEITPERYKYLERWQGIRDVCIKCGVHYIGLADESGMGWARLNNNMGIDYNTDNIHHTDIGGYNLAVYMWSKLKDIPCWHTSVPEDMSELLTRYRPYVEIGLLTAQGVWGKKFYEKQYYRTPRYMRVTDKILDILTIEDCDIRVCQYGEEFNFLKIIDFTTVKADEAKQFALDSSCAYVRLVFRKSSSVPNFETPEIYVNNVENKEYFEIRPADNGYEKILAHIDVDGEILPDYGVLCLPETYTNTGEPTRLIIFCHGAAVNYPASVTRFVDTDINPEYWLKEGYAIMDIEGNPFDNTNEHFYIPQARQSYETAYDWVTNIYNIRTDGVFLAGRSMGGGMCFELLQSDIPVIAACPIVPVCNQLWYWNYLGADRKEFCSNKMGFTSTKPTWTSNKKLSDEEYQYLYDNFNQMLQHSPFWRGIENLPDKDVLFSVGKVSANTSYDAAEDELYSILSFKTKAPVKIFTCYEDTTVPYRRNALLMYNMLKNGGVECELSLVHTDASSGHRYELQDSQAYIDVTTLYGENVSAPWVYVDILEFWRKYEQR